MTRSEKIEMLYLKLDDMVEKLEAILVNRNSNSFVNNCIKNTILTDDLYKLINDHKAVDLNSLSESGKLLFTFMDNLKVSEKTPTFEFMEVVYADDTMRYDVSWEDIYIYSTKSFPSFEVGCQEIDSIASHLGFKIVINGRRTILK